MLNRRDLVKKLLASIALDPERLMWVSGTKLISIPKPNYSVDRGWYVWSDPTGYKIEYLRLIPIPISYTLSNKNKLT